MPCPFFSLTAEDGMITPKQFLESVLPAGGKYFLFGIKQGARGASNSVRQLGVNSVDELLEKSAEFVTGGYDAFFGLAAFHTHKTRIVANVDQLKSFYLDIDCGENKPYADASEGLKALRRFCKSAHVPKPTVISSGRGLHAYWVFTEPVSYQEWIPHAEAFKKSCVAKGFNIDLSVPADAARVLRIPGTKHLKDPENPLDVAILMEGEVRPFTEYKDLFPVIFDSLSIPGKRLNYTLDPTTQRLMGNKEHSFKKIMQLSLKDMGCGQLKNAYLNQATINYELWRAALSIADKCVDREDAVIKISQRHPDYNRDTALEKAADSKPHYCETFKRLNPAGCEGCQMKVSTPLHIHTRIVEASPEENVVVQEDKETKIPQTHVIPQFPFPYIRGKLGGIYKKAEDSEENDVLVYPYDFYPTKRIKDPELGHTIVFKLHLPRDGVVEFMIPLASILSKDRFRDAIAMHGMAVLPKQVDYLMAYVTKWVDQLATSSELEQARVQFGWTPDNDAIILGSDEITATEIKYSPPTSQTLSFVPMYRAKGSFEEWKNVVNVYGKRGHEPRAFAFFMGFGSLLVRFSKVEGFVLHLMSNGSGSGKSTILHAIASIYGNPKPQIVNAKDTYNAKMQIMGTLHNLPALYDEITNMTQIEKSDIVYQATQGRAKHKAKAHESGIRVNTTSWETALISTGNSSLVDDMLALKAIPDGELNRLLELFIEKDTDGDPEWSREHFGKLYDNYGHAARPFCQYLVAHLEEVLDLMANVRKRIDKLADTQNSERYWSAMAGVAITAGIISRKLGLHDIDHIPVMHYIVNQIKASRTTAKKYIADPGESVSSYLYSHLDEIVIANGTKDKRTNLDTQAIREPRGRAMSVRYEPDTKMLYVSSSAYRQYCQKLQISFEESLRPHRKSKALVADDKKKRLGAGTSFSGINPIAVLQFDVTKLPNFDEKALENVDSNGAADTDRVD